MKIADDISVVIPTYNGSKFIEDTIKSIYSQTVLPREIIVVDDVSTDNTKEIIERLQDISPIPLHFIQLDKNSGGPAKPINVGIEKAKGEYIAICEQDDLMLPNKIEMLDKFIQIDPRVEFIISKYEVLIYSDVKNCTVRDSSYSEFEDIIKKSLKGPYFYLDKKSAYQKALQKCFAVSLSNMCFSKRLWDDMKGFNEELKRIVDWDFLIRVSYSNNIGWINYPLWVFRRHCSSTDHNTPTYVWIKERIKLWRKELKRKDLTREIKSELCWKLFNHYEKLNKNFLARFYFLRTFFYDSKNSLARYYIVSYLETNIPILYKLLRCVYKLIFINSSRE